MFVHRTVANYILWNVVKSGVEISSETVFADILQRYNGVSRSGDSKQYVVFFCHCYTTDSSDIVNKQSLKDQRITGILCLYTRR